MSRKEEIIYATLELASANGMKGVSMSQIAEKVGIKASSRRTRSSRRCTVFFASRR